jgi:hypothetical protein
MCSLLKTKLQRKSILLWIISKTLKNVKNKHQFMTTVPLICSMFKRYEKEKTNCSGCPVFDISKKSKHLACYGQKGDLNPLDSLKKTQKIIKSLM